MRINHLSPSSIDMYTRCPRQFAYRYLMGLKIPPAVAQLFGNAYHHTLEENFTSKIHNGVDLPMGAAQAIFSDQWDRNVKDVNWLYEKEDRGVLKDTGVRLVTNYISNVAPYRNPLYIEHEFEIDLDGIPLIGRIDFVGNDNSILEHKTSSRKWAQVRADGTIQATGYALAMSRIFGSIPNTITYDIAVKDSIGTIQTLETHRSDIDIRLFTEQAQIILLAVEHEVLPRTSEENWWCSEKFCGYYPNCRQGRSLSSINVIQDYTLSSESDI